jgi:hypothetical protein
VFTRLLDQKAQTLLSGLPARDATTRPEPAVRPSSPPSDGGAEGGAAMPGGDGAAGDVTDAAETPPETLPNPEGDEVDQAQDDETVAPLPDAPEQDHR